MKASTSLGSTDGHSSGFWLRQSDSRFWRHVQEGQTSPIFSAKDMA